VSKEYYDTVMKYKDILNKTIDHARDFEYDYFGYKTLEKSYLLKMDGKISERPQCMLMRVAVGIHGDDIDRVVDTYEGLSRRYFTHATPTLFNAGTNTPQMSSCFLLTMKEDSIDGIYETLKNCAIISKYAGGIGLAATIFVLVNPISAELMVLQTVLFLCCVYLIIQLVTLIKVAANAKEALPFT